MRLLCVLVLACAVRRAADDILNEYHYPGVNTPPPSPSHWVNYTEVYSDYNNSRVASILPVSYPVDPTQDARLALCGNKSVSEGCDCKPWDDPNMAQALQLSEDCAGTCVLHNGDLTCQEVSLNRGLVLACKKDAAGQNYSFATAMRFRKRLYGTPLAEYLTSEESEATLKVMNAAYQNLLLRDKIGLFDRRFNHDTNQPNGSTTSDSQISQPCFMGLNASVEPSNSTGYLPYGEQLHIGHCKPPSFNGRTDGTLRFSECKSDFFRYRAEEACIGRTPGAACSIDSGQNVTLTGGSCMRTTLGDLICQNRDWRWIREDACQQTDPGQMCRFRAKASKDGDVNASYLTTYTHCPNNHPGCGRMYNGICRSLPMVCSELTRVEGVGIKNTTSNDTNTSLLQLSQQKLLEKLMHIPSVDRSPEPSGAVRNDFAAQLLKEASVQQTDNSNVRNKADQ